MKSPVLAQQPVYFIGWDYKTPASVALKRLLARDDSPWRAAAIVHDETFVPAVDGIPLLRSDNFMAMARAQPGRLHACLYGDGAPRKLWERRAQALGIHLHDEGEAFRAAASLWKETGARASLGLLDLPDAFDDAAAQALQDCPVQWSDAASRQVFKAYLEFLATGLCDSLRSVALYSAEHPVLDASGIWSDRVKSLGGGLAWEIAEQRTSFLERVLVASGGRGWHYAYSSETSEAAAVQGGLVRRLLGTFGLPVEQSVWPSAVPGEPQRVSGCSLPSYENAVCLVHLDVVRPVNLLRAIREGCARGCFVVRVGRDPRQLLEILQAFPDAPMRLQCDRPGPLGLHVTMLAA